MRANLSMVENVSIFDTYKHIKALQESGFKEEQARVIAESLLASRDSDLSKLVTKEVFLVANNELKKEIGELRVEIDSVKSELREEMAIMNRELRDIISSAKNDAMRWVVMVLATIVLSCIGTILAVALK